MSIIKFITSKTFLKQILLAVVAVVVLCFIMLKWLNITTNHGDFETVPQLTGKSISVAEMELKDNNLVMKIQDSANYNPDYPKFSVIEQDPQVGTQVKKDRKIYITLNPSGYRKMNIPEGLIDKTFRQVKPNLEALGFKIGKITYVDNIGKDMVLKLSHKGKTLNAGDKLAKTSVIDLVLGNGNRP
ncbi:PASTA domain-containing protein [Algibacter amylolyticus]|uniref:PASTA domain-containing protein n=1 Tax=Algibacter amylolyticus TaxID=1608400 RepID=A0A5M7B3E4_9FLAO|nr:PASTA domain-containing protein [Algibacter amylolyticus]KAA5824103.1 PASTA domain-containing protein [Algibacter amylolyticus]MBB5269660.1 beta-lactam-binding protein with PASTA domain [Algibacter amylolyticus]TSJ74580.1 PASTA domain-containing protein [Algibacter amylolyticus]